MYVINIILETYLKLSYTRCYRNKRDAALHTASRSVELYDNPQGFTNHIPKIYMGTGDILYYVKSCKQFLPFGIEKNIDDPTAAKEIPRAQQVYFLTSGPLDFNLLSYSLSDKVLN